MPLGACFKQSGGVQQQQHINAGYVDPSQLIEVDDKLIVEELNGLTFEERNRINDEVHGVADLVEETPEMITASLKSMGEELAKVPKKNRKALDRAIFLRPCLPSDDKFHMMFLRSERFDPIQAAAKMYRHFEHKFELFGDELLVSKITLDDLGEKEMALMHTGSIQLLTSNDSVCRGVLLMTSAANDLPGDLDVKAVARYGWYQILTAIEDDEELQRRGVVRVSNVRGKIKWSSTQMIDTVLRTRHITADWPFRKCGYHLCYDNPTFRSFIKTLVLVSGKELRLRERTHFGSDLEVQYALMTFGIQLAGALTPGQGILSKGYTKLNLEKRRQIEVEWKRQKQAERDAQPDFVETPNSYDVLMGRGVSYRSWVGNQRFLNLVKEFVDPYMEASQGRIEKTMIAIEIVQRVQLDGGRFIERTSNGWKTVSDHVAKDKISQILRAEVRTRRAVSRGISTPKMAVEVGSCK